ncbi:uncharacterized protein LOC120979860 [Bufo bufo]|uniref:uncharacterized protein LOC120979860 n=1 Tax=Bufo bufo TaxID=8384 RepID=UPI001ABEB4D7|nr:uncharacterized protein LOC120979860 [Bufo bufo]
MYTADLGFLRRTMAPRRTASSTRGPEQPSEAELERIATASPPVTYASAQDNPVPLPDPSPQQRLLGFWPNLRALVSRQRSSRPSRNDYVDLVEVVSDALEGFAEHQKVFSADLIRRWEGVESAIQRSPNYHYGLSIINLMDSMTPEQLHEFKIMLENGSWETMHRPQPPPRSDTYPPSHTSAHYRQPSHSQPPEHVFPSVSYSTSPPNYFPPISFQTPSTSTHAWVPSSSDSSIVHTPQFHLSSFPVARSFISDNRQDRGATIASPRPPTTRQSTSPPNFAQL